MGRTGTRCRSASPGSQRRRRPAASWSTGGSCASTSGRATGRRPPLLLVNGIGASLELLQPFVDALDPAIEVIRFDVPGSRRLAAARPALPLHRPVPADGAPARPSSATMRPTCSASPGAAGSPSTSPCSSPRRCRRLVLVGHGDRLADGAGQAVGAGPDGHPAPLPGPQLPAADRGRPVRRLRPQPSRTASAALMHAEQPGRPGAGYLYQLAAGAGWTSLPFLPLLRQPTLILSGDDDPLIPLANARLMHSLHPALSAARLPRRPPGPGHRGRPSSRRWSAGSWRPTCPATATARRRTAGRASRPHSRGGPDDQRRRRRLLPSRAAARRRRTATRLQRVREFMDKEVEPVINRYWTREEFPHELIPGFAELGIAGTPYTGYGCPGRRPAAGRDARDGAGPDRPVDRPRSCGVHSGLAMGSIYLCGSEEQKQRWLPRDGPDGADRRVRADRAGGRLRRRPAG